MAFARLKADLDDYAKNKTWYWYLPFWLFGVYLFIKLLDFKLDEPAPSFFISIAQSLDFFLHEMAHLFTAFLPSILTAAAGSFSELFLGIGLIVTAFWTRSYFANLFCGLWFMLATWATADYMADARTQNLPLVSFGGSDPTHDWNFIFGKLGLLEQDTLIADLTRGLGTIVALLSLGFSAWLLIKIARAKAEAAHKTHLDSNAARLSPAEREAKPFLGGDLYPSAQKGPLSNRDDPTRPKEH